MPLYLFEIDMIRKIQLEIPRLTHSDEYTFPYWSVEDRVAGQPINQLATKYNATYKRVAETMISLGPYKFKELVLMGLFATNHRTIGDYLQFQFIKQNCIPPVIKHTAVVERNPLVCSKILEIESKFKQLDNLSIIPSLLKSITYKSGNVGRPPEGVQSILRFQKNWKGLVNFIDADLMCNWGKKQELHCIAKIANLYSNNHCVIHVNAISNHPRTIPWSTNQDVIKNILQKEVLNYIEAKTNLVGIESYSTYSINNVKTEMTSAIFTVER